jgi:hypothetical protein
MPRDGSAGRQTCWVGREVRELEALEGRHDRGAREDILVRNRSTWTASTDPFG